MSDRSYYRAFAVFAGVAGVLTLATVAYVVATPHGRGPGVWVAMGVFLLLGVGLLGFAARARRL